LFTAPYTKCNLGLEILTRRVKISLRAWIRARLILILRDGGQSCKAEDVFMIARERWGLYEPDTEHDSCGIGFVAHIKGEKSRGIVEQGLEVLRRLSHRAACGADPDTSDGAGILLQLPHRFFKAEGLRLGLDMPRRRRYG